MPNRPGGTPRIGTITPPPMRGSLLDRIPQFRAIALDRLVAAGKIREIDRERVTFIVRTIVNPPDDSRSENAWASSTAHEELFASDNASSRRLISDPSELAGLLVSCLPGPPTKLIQRNGGIPVVPGPQWNLDKP
jgi:hypothetical protein